MINHPCCQTSKSLVIGIDEVGRGSLISDVVTSAVCFTRGMPEGLKDSKTISANKRLLLEPKIKKVAHYGIGRASIQEIDELGILNATLLAMKRAWLEIDEDIRNNSLVIIDGDKAPPITAEMIIMPKADQLCPTVSAASILAKVCRDREIEKLGAMDNRYGWAKNKGYGTKDHQRALEIHGPSEHHRKSFNPVRSMLRAKYGSGSRS